MVTLAVALVFRVCVSPWMKYLQGFLKADIPSPRRKPGPSDLRGVKVTGPRLSPGRRFAKQFPSGHDNGSKRERAAFLAHLIFCVTHGKKTFHAYSSPGSTQHIGCVVFVATSPFHAIFCAGQCGRGAGLARVFRTRGRQRNNGEWVAIKKRYGPLNIFHHAMALGA